MAAAHVNILSLPMEIIHLIGNVRFQNSSHIYSYRSQPQDSQDRDYLSLKTLRLVCSQFNLAFEAQVLSTLVILVTANTLKQSTDMLWMFASQNKKTSRAVQHARTLEIKYLSPVMALDPGHFRIPEPEPPSLIRRLETAISSLERHFEWVCSLSSFLRDYLTW